MIEERIADVEPSQAKGLRDGLCALFGMENFERDYYSRQLQRFDGEIFNIVKGLLQQEEKHILVLRQVLARAGIKAPETMPEVPDPPKGILDVVKADIGYEEKTTKLYNETLAKFGPAIGNSDGALREILTFIRDEELRHIEILKEYLGEASKE